MTCTITTIALLLVFLCPSVLSADGTVAAAPRAYHQYIITDLGSLGGLYTEPQSINDIGQIVGYSQDANANRHAFIWQRGKMARLDVTKGDHVSLAYAINNKSQTVGISYLENGAIHGTLWSQGRTIDLGLIGDDKLNTGSVQGINDKGQIIVNFVSYPDSSILATVNLAAQHHRVLLSTTTSMSIQQGRLLGHNIIGVSALNNSGAIVGIRLDNTSHCPQGFLWENGRITDLGDFLPDGINAAGTMIGTRIFRHGKQRVPAASLWKNGKEIALHSPISDSTFGVAINNKEEVIGVTNLGDPRAALLWSGGSCIELNNALLPKGEWTQISPKAINNLGQIVGTGRHNGKLAAFLMTPRTAQ